MRPVIVVSGMWAGSVAGAGLRDLIAQDYPGEVFVASKERYKHIGTVRGYKEGVKQEFAHLKDPILVGHSLGGLVSLQLAEEDFTNRYFCICPAIPVNYFNPAPAALGAFWRPLLTRKPFIPDIPSFKKYFAQDCRDSDIEQFHKTFFEEQPSLFDDFVLRRSSAAIQDFESIKRKAKGEFFSALGDTICLTRFHKKMAERLEAPLHIVEGSHTPFVNDKKGILKEKILTFLKASQ